MKRKLNLLVPGSWFCLIFLILALLDGLLYALKMETAAAMLAALLGAALLVFLVLLAVEQRQDRKQYLKAKALDKDIK